MKVGEPSAQLTQVPTTVCASCCTKPCEASPSPFRPLAVAVSASITSLIVVTKGHHVSTDEIWFSKLAHWLQDFVGDAVVSYVNGAAPATGSDYFSFCFPLHIPTNSDLVLVELAINDEAIPEHVENMENLIRGLLDLPTKPAVILVEAIAFSTGGMGGGGGRIHLPVAQYYDVPVIK
jgi:hypothetical protein